MHNEIDTNNYAIVRFAGKNYKISVGNELEVDGLTAHDVGAEVVIDKVLVRVSRNSDSAQGSDQGVQIGAPFVPNSKVAMRVVSSKLGKKVLIFKKRRRGGYTKYQGHRQLLTRLVVDKIDG